MGEFDWQLFWLLEVLFLGAPSLITVLTLPRSQGHIDHLRLEVLLLLVVGLTVVNILWLFLGGSFFRRGNMAELEHQRRIAQLGDQVKPNPGRHTSRRHGLRLTPPRARSQSPLNR